MKPTTRISVSRIQRFLEDQESTPRQATHNSREEDEEMDDFGEKEKKPFTLGKAFMIVCVAHLVGILGMMFFFDGGSPKPKDSKKKEVAAKSTDTRSQLAKIPPGIMREDQDYLNGLEANAANGQKGNSQSLSKTKLPPTAISPGGIVAPSNDADTYVVKAGDTLWGISRAVGVSVDQLIALNGLSNPDKLKSGQVLRIDNISKQVQSAGGSSMLSQGSVEKSQADKTARVSTSKSSNEIEQAKLRGQWLRTQQDVSDLPMDVEETVVQQERVPATSRVELAEYAPQSSQTQSANNADVPVKNPYTQNQIQKKPAIADRSAGEKQDYVLNQGDNLYAIAKRFDVSYEDLRNANNISDPRDLIAGQSLVIPSSR